jgi:hypothetical protein
LTEEVQPLQSLRDPALVDFEGVMIILAELGEAESALLLQCGREAVLQTLIVVVIDLCYNVEGQKVLNDIEYYGFNILLKKIKYFI